MTNTCEFVEYTKPTQTRAGIFTVRYTSDEDTEYMITADSDFFNQVNKLGKNYNLKRGDQIVNSGLDELDHRYLDGSNFWDGDKMIVLSASLNGQNYSQLTREDLFQLNPAGDYSTVPKELPLITEFPTNYWGGHTPSYGYADLNQWYDEIIKNALTKEIEVPIESNGCYSSADKRRQTVQVMDSWFVHNGKKCLVISDDFEQMKVVMKRPEVSAYCINQDLTLDALSSDYTTKTTDNTDFLARLWHN